MIGAVIMCMGIMPACMVSGERVAMWPMCVYVLAVAAGFIADIFLGV